MKVYYTKVYEYKNVTNFVLFLFIVLFLLLVISLRYKIN